MEPTDNNVYAQAIGDWIVHGFPDLDNPANVLIVNALKNTLKGTNGVMVPSLTAAMSSMVGPGQPSPVVPDIDAMDHPTLVTQFFTLAVGAAIQAETVRAANDTARTQQNQLRSVMNSITVTPATA